MGEPLGMGVVEAWFERPVNREATADERSLGPPDRRHRRRSSVPPAGPPARPAIRSAARCPHAAYPTQPEQLASFDGPLTPLEQRELTYAYPTQHPQSIIILQSEYLTQVATNCNSTPLEP